MISRCPRCGRSLQGLRILTYDSVVLSSDGSRMVAASELPESTWRVFCSAGHEVGAAEVISLSIPSEALDDESSAIPSGYEDREEQRSIRRIK